MTYQTVCRYCGAERPGSDRHYATCAACRKEIRKVTNHNGYLKRKGRQNLVPLRVAKEKIAHVQPMGYAPMMPGRTRQHG